MVAGKERGFEQDILDQLDYLGAVANLRLYEVLLLACAFLLITASLGLYNSDTAQDFRTFAKRFVLAWQLVFLITVVFVRGWPSFSHNGLAWFSSRSC